MEGGGRAEAVRWLTIAEKLLTSRDLHGVKSFAIRAREADPTLDTSDQIIAVADTLLAGDSRINGRSHDWYAILQLARLTQNPELIATQYRKLALLLNPDRNRFPFVDQAFKLVSDAWLVLSNPSRKSLYDNELQMNQFGHFSQQQFNQAATAAAAAAPAPSASASATATATATPVRRSARNKDGKTVVEEERPISNNKTEPTRSTRTTRTSTQPTTESEAPSFWTACPYCYNMYEYPRIYEDCTLRCQNCRRAFHAVVVASPPVTGKDAYFCCWGYFPLGFSGNAKDTSAFSNWMPISPMFACPLQSGAKNVGRPKGAKKPVQRVYYDDDEDDIIDLSESSDDSDDEWEKNERKKKAKNVKGRGATGKNGRKAQTGNVGSFENARDVNVAPEAESSKRAGGSGVKRQGVRGTKDLGKLDLNVEFSNEVEEPVPGMDGGHAGGHGEEDNIEGMFFEGLDEFLSSLPILSVVGDDKVKAN